MTISNKDDLRGIYGQRGILAVSVGNLAYHLSRRGIGNFKVSAATRLHPFTINEHSNLLKHTGIRVIGGNMLTSYRA